MLTSPYRKLMQHKRWATDGLNGVVAEHMARIDEADRVLVLRLLDHIEAVDEIFRHNLERRPHGHAAPRSAELPDFETLARKARATGAWYADHVGALTPNELDEPIDFTFSNGMAARMTRGEMLLHVATHGAGHRGQVAMLLLKNGIQPFPDRMTDFLEAAGVAAR